MNKVFNGRPILEGQPNFRSLDGIPAAGGRKIRKNMIYRSGNLSNLSASDILLLENAGLALVIDFRSDRELESHPTVVIPSVRKTIRIVIPDEARDQAMEYLDNNNAEGLENILVTDYRRMIRNESERFSLFFRTLENTSDLPLVYHCAAGKDRTGLATVMLLSALGVDHELVRQDYFLSNLRLRNFADKLVAKITEDGRNGEIIRPMMEVRREYLDAAIDEIEILAGSMENYLTDVLLVDSELLKSKYLE